MRGNASPPCPSDGEPGIPLGNRLRYGIAGTVAMAICLFGESGLGHAFPEAIPLLVVLGAPLLEESMRFISLRLTGIEDRKRGTFLGAMMGLAETGFKLAARNLSGEAVAFRGLVTLPFHALLGGILARGPGRFSLAVALHAAFNLGVLLGGPGGSVVFLGAVATAATFWFLDEPPPPHPSGGPGGAFRGPVPTPPD